MTPSSGKVGRKFKILPSYQSPSLLAATMANFIPFLFFLCALLIGGTNSSSSGEMSPEAYWKKLLPKTPIPDSLQPFLPKDLTNGLQKKASVPVIDRYAVWRSGVTPEELKSLHDTEFLFLPENLKPGSKTKKLDFVKKEREGRNGWNALLPRRTVEAFPFSVSKLDGILKYFSIEPTSVAAKDMKKTLAACEEEANKGETRYCATSLESMVDFAISQLKTNDIRLLSTSILDKETAPKARVYTVENGVAEFPSKNPVICHILGYPYAVFYCHKTVNTSFYVSPLVAEEDGSRVDAGAVCHTETSLWNPNHAIFLSLGVKPGTPVCHFLPYGHFVFVPNSASY